MPISTSVHPSDHPSDHSSIRQSIRRSVTPFIFGGFDTIMISALRCQYWSSFPSKQKLVFLTSAMDGGRGGVPGCLCLNAWSDGMISDWYFLSQLNDPSASSAALWQHHPNPHMTQSKIPQSLWFQAISCTTLGSESLKFLFFLFCCIYSSYMHTTLCQQALLCNLIKFHQKKTKQNK